MNAEDAKHSNKLEVKNDLFKSIFERFGYDAVLFGNTMPVR